MVPHFHMSLCFDILLQVKTRSSSAGDKMVGAACLLASVGGLFNGDSFTMPSLNNNSVYPALKHEPWDQRLHFCGA